MSTNPTEWHKIIVPLDGSELAERAVPVAAHLARATESALVLVQVIPTLHWMYLPPEPVPASASLQQILEDQEHAARHYLDHLADTLRAEGLRVETLVTQGEPASTLIDLGPQTQAGLVVMASHGRTGMARFTLGSVADRVLRHGHVPVLLVRAFGEDRRNTRLEHALVPLDGSRLAEQALEMAAWLAGVVLRQVTLVRVVDPESRTGETNEAQVYLDDVRARLAERLRGRACAIDTTILYGRAAEQIIERSEHDCDLVLMATHGRTGATRWGYGSVADRVLRGMRAPLLLVRAQIGAERG
jgi:nucleotide-binding universal stress UspA family protein